jgi:hypothetical protein
LDKPEKFIIETLPIKNWGARVRTFKFKYDMWKLNDLIKKIDAVLKFFLDV